jgi:hypothetical protein
VVDAINRHPNFKITYPIDHGIQHSIAEGFRQVSSANFECCAGAIDGININRLSEIASYLDVARESFYADEKRSSD